MNPILINEFRIKTRCWKYYSVSIIYVFVLSGLVFAMIWAASSGKETSNPGYKNMLFFFVVLTLAICAICPAFTASAISSEKERLTFELLKVTLLKPRHIITGKLTPAFIYILILVLVSFPVVILIMPVTGVSLTAIIYCYLIVLISVITFSLLGFMYSSIFRRTRIAAVMTYATIGVFIFGTMITPVILSRIFHVKISANLLNLFKSLNSFHAINNALNNAGSAAEILGLPIWLFLIISYLTLSVISILVTIIILNKATTCCS